MNDLLQKHGCSNVFTVPEGLKELMSDITREVLREQPKNICDFISNYLSALLITREHGVMAVRILEDLCDCRPSVSEHLIQLGLEKDIANSLAQVIKNEIENFERKKEKEKIKESSILKKILSRAPLDEEMAAKVCQIARNAYKDYWYKKKLMEQSVTMRAEEPWEVAAERTLAMYKKTKPSIDELHRATERIQAAYRGYYVRRNLLEHLKPKKRRPKETLGAPLDIAGSREIDLGPVTDINVREDDVNALFAAHATSKLEPHNDSIKTTAIEKDNERNKNPIEKSPTGYKMMDQDTRDLDTRLHTKTNPEVGVVQMESRKDSRSASHDVKVKSQGINEREQLDTYNEELASRYGDTVIENRAFGAPARKISFSMVSPEMIPNEYLDEDQEIQEAIQESLEDIETENPQEIPEDLPDAVIGEDANSSPVASAASLISTDMEEENDQ